MLTFLIDELIQMKIKKLILLLCLSLVSPIQLMASAFDKGVVNASIIFGSGRAYNDSYNVLGVGIGYFLVNGLHIGLDYEYWSGGEPTIQQISPRVSYVFNRNGGLSPYVGAFYRKTKIDTLPDSDAYGGRAGVYLRSGGNFVLGAGMAYIEYSDCEKTVFNDCSDTYPEFSFAAYF
jgi:hypothetical protein